MQCFRKGWVNLELDRIVQVYKDRPTLGQKLA